MSAQAIAAVWEGLAPGLPWPWDDVARMRSRDWKRYAAYERRLGRALTWAETEKLFDRCRRGGVTYGNVWAGFKEGEYE